MLLQFDFHLLQMYGKQLKAYSNDCAMSKSKKRRQPAALIQRICFAEDEKKYSWLSMLLDAYYITDQGVAEGVELMRRKGHRLACAKGCCSCCVTHRSIPVYPLELVGISWYAVEKLPEPFRSRLQVQLRGHRKGDPCGFLIDGVCSIHPLRPMACRQFNVFNRTCEEGEDAYYTRRHEVLTPLKKYTDKAFMATMPFYGAKTRAESRKIVEKGLMHMAVKDMQQCNWQSLVDKMASFEKRKH